MTSKQIRIISLICHLAPLLVLFIVSGCGSGSDPKEPSPSGESDSAFSMPLPKGLWAPASDSDLVMTAQAVIDPGTSGARTVDLAVDLTAGRVTGVIEGVSAGPHTVEIQYFVNQVQVATVTLNVDVVPGQNNPVQISPAAIHYVEAVSDTLFVADAADRSIKIFDRYSMQPGGVVQASPTRTLQGASTGITGASTGSLFVDSIGGLLYFADSQDNSVLIWRNAATVSGDTPPDRVLKGQATRLLQPTGIAVDPFRNRLYVVNHNGEIFIWNDLTSLEEETPPTAVLVGSLTAGDHPVFLDVKRDMLYVANGEEISVFEKLSGLTGDIQNVAPVPTILIAGESLSQAGLALDFSQNLLLISSRDSNGTIYRVAEASTASGAVAPAATLAGTETGLNQTSTVILAGNVLMALNLGGREIQVWHQADQKNGDASPTQILELDSTSLPTALFYVATQNGERDQAQETLQVEKTGNGNGRVTSDLPGINCGTTCASSFGRGNIITLTAGVEGDSTFDGWGGVCSGTDPCVVTMDAAKKVTATFTLKPYALSVSKVGTGTGTVTSVPAGINCGSDCNEPYPHGTEVTLTASPDANSDFAGWSGACTGTGDCVVTIDSAKSVVATFNLKRFTLTVSRSGTGAGTVTSNPAGINCPGDCSQTYNIDTAVTLTATSDGNSNFTGWSGGGCTGTGTCVVTIDAAKTVTATFTLKSLGVSVNKAGNGSGTVTSAPPGIDCGDDCSELYTVNTEVALTATAAADSNFTGWSGACTGTGACRVTIDAAKSVTATFTLKTFTVTVAKSGTGDGTVMSNPFGINCGTDCSQTFNIHTEVTLTANSNSSSNFSGWSGGGCSGTGACVVTVDTAKSVTANFTLKTFSLTITKSGSGTGTVASSPAGINCGTDCSETYDIDTLVFLTATPNSDSEFSGWSGACSGGADTCSVTMDAAKTVTANFTRRFPLTVSKSGTGAGTVASNPSGINCGGDCSETYNINTQVTLTAAPNADSDFVEWSGCDSAAGTSCTITMNAAKSVTATFTLKVFTLTVTKMNTGGNGPVTSAPAGINCGTDCSQTFNINTEVTLTASPNNSSIFTGWSGACTGTGRTCIVTMDASKTVTASYTAKPVLTVTKMGTGSGTVTSTPAGINCGTDCTQSYDNFTTQVTLTAVAGADSAFTGWSGACSGTGSCVVAMDAGKTVRADFTLTGVALNVTVTGNGTVTSNPPGINCGTDCSGTYPIDSTMTLTATPAADSDFVGWGGACTGSAETCDVTLDAAKTVTAAFALKRFTLTVNLDPAGNGSGRVTAPGIDCGAGSADCSEVYTLGTSVELAAQPELLSQFSNWSGDCTGATSPCTLFIDSNKSVQARFDLILLPAP
jgi:hypothetical protein